MNAKEAGLRALIECLVAIGASREEVDRQVAAFEREWSR